MNTTQLDTTVAQAVGFVGHLKAEVDQAFAVVAAVGPMIDRFMADLETLLPANTAVNTKIAAAQAHLDHLVELVAGEAPFVNGVIDLIAEEIEAFYSAGKGLVAAVSSLGDNLKAAK